LPEEWTNDATLTLEVMSCDLYQRIPVLLSMRIKGDSSEGA